MTRDLFWFAAGVLATLAGLLVAWPLLRPGAAASSTWRARTAGVVAVAVIIAATSALYRLVGTPAALEVGTAAPAATPHATGPGDGAALSLEAATARLAARLAAAGGSPEEWELLARSYEATGRSAEADAARARAAAPPPPAGAAAAQAEMDAAAALRGQGDLDGALAAYAGLAARDALTARGWADYADTAASRADGRLAGAPARYIERALALDPVEPKALWLRASLAFQEQRYADAVRDWVALRAALPAGSPDQQVVAANLEESARLAGMPVPQGPASPASATAGGPRITGSVDIAPALRGQAPPGRALFIYAKEAGAAGPPLAVLRLPVDAWPVSFTLDDSHSMVPGRTLSAAGRVVVEARVSATGNALPAGGDLVGTLSGVDPRSGASVRVVIDRVL